MKLIGEIEHRDDGWFAHCDLIGAWTQGKSLADAKRALVDCVEALLDDRHVEVTLAEIAQDRRRCVVEVSASDPAKLAQRLLAYQRGRHGLSLADVAERLGTDNRHAYARYERGLSQPSLGKYVELLSAVAPELALTVRAPAAKPHALKAKRARKAS